MSDIWASTVPGGQPPAPLPHAADVDAGQHIFDDHTPIGGVPVVHSPRRWKRRAAWSAVGVVVAAIAYYGITLFQVHSTGQSDHAGPTDAIVVMGAAQYDGTPSPLLRARLDHVVELWGRQIAPLVVVTGGNQPGDRFTEAAASKAYLVDHGVPVDAILEESVGQSSYDSLEGVSRLLHDRGLDRVVLVSDPFHSLRIQLTARELGLDAVVSPTRTSPVQGGDAVRREMKEAAGVALGRVVGFRRLLAITG